ncbi:PHP domain-containing protein [Desulfuromonas acetoxidans]|uniref:PHP-like n=1 Tax=Desulfuromonas acetoxidans (strain DSM 684 / 11070) TaxID=281689 RepID=Q1JW79_DESA6|nr:PHP domain-containing protein [Desulfuromonas acetoxidans]EAT14489.1 PHP-like [Desulfuromonas acetoxidans DSM 684]MBF0646231.1 PHP domain-containing protein [Desulfuromonas acetoxidans]NVD25075.1 PHP domain-containing protein [Desulfuromonas acetoxidans]NVE17120.1 PHP domain-containing protein [Desulfuromonas acetoxidans]
MMEQVDLHTHSCCSDGAFTPQQLIEKAAQNHVVAMALCDHDNIDGVEPARQAGHQRGIDVISGVELSCVWKEFEDIHLLGYGFDPRHPRLIEELSEFQQFRRQRNALIVDKINERLQQRGLQPICYEKVAERAGGTIGRPHIAMELMAAGYAKTVEEAFVKYLSPCNIAKKFFPVDEAMALIHEAGGVAVLAHPPYISRDPDVMTTLLDDLTALGLQGVEVYNNGANCDEIEWYLTQIRLRGLFATGGSDFHGIEDGGAELGKIRAIGSIPYNCYTTLREVLSSHDDQ